MIQVALYCLYSRVKICALSVSDTGSWSENEKDSCDTYFASRCCNGQIKPLFPLHDGKGGIFI